MNGSLDRRRNCRCAARYGDPFTLRTAWADGPIVFVSDPASAPTIFTAEPSVLRGGVSNAIIEPLVGSSSLLLNDGPESVRRRKLMLPPFHGERCNAGAP